MPPGRGDSPGPRGAAMVRAMTQADFSGAKVAVLAGGKVLTLLRDDRQGLPFAGMWDLPGGGREGAEGPLDCALREAFEETGVRVDRGSVRWERVFPGPGEEAPRWFFVAEPGWLALPKPRLGDEGQAVRWMPEDEFLARGDAIGAFQERLRAYRAEKAVRAWRAGRLVRAGGTAGR